MLTGRGIHADREPYYTNGLHSDDQCLICRDYEERENGRENKRDKKEAIKLRKYKNLKQNDCWHSKTRSKHKKVQTNAYLF